MSRYIGPVCRLCRREGMKLFLKGMRCSSAKCAISRRDYAPGMHAWRRGRFSKYGVQLREKQKVKRSYGVMDEQFKVYFRRATHSKGNTGQTLLLTLERRLDNVLYLLGFAVSRAQSRQIIVHGHVLVNGHTITSPSYLVKQNDSVMPARDDKSLRIMKWGLEMNKGRNTPSWLEMRAETVEGRVINLPNRDEVSVPVEEQMIVELMSR